MTIITLSALVRQGFLNFKL